jgi:hypothetical protein
MAAPPIENNFGRIDIAVTPYGGGPSKNFSGNILNHRRRAAPGTL